MIEVLWHITVGSWVTAAAVILLRLLFRKHLSAKSKYLLWLLLMLRLMLPVLPESPVSVLNAKSGLRTAVATEFQQPVQETNISAASTVVQTAAVPIKSGVTASEWLIGIWAVGVLVCGASYGWMTIQTARRLRSMEEIQSIGVKNRYEAIRQQLGIRRTVTLRYGDCAMIGGLLHPTLILHRELAGQRLKAAITHELMHERSGDLWIAAWWRLLCCVYWFNPVVWLCFFWARRDCEKA